MDEYKKQQIKIMNPINDKLTSTGLIFTCNWLKIYDYMQGRTNRKTHVRIRLCKHLLFYEIICLLMLPLMNPSRYKIEHFY